MASAEVQSAPAEGVSRELADVSNMSLGENQATLSTQISSKPIELNNMSAPQPSHPSPLPSPITTSMSGQPSTTDASASILPALPPPVVKASIESSKENYPGNGQSSLAPLNFDPQSRAPLSSVRPAKPSSPISADPPPLTRQKTAPAIGPATDKPTPIPKESEIEGPVLFITLLLTTGARHPYKLDQKYLKKRNVEVEGNNPINMSLYKLKELILRDWRDEWEAKPSSPESIRLISMGKMLNDKSRLADGGFTNGTTPHIIHMTMKPQEIVDEEDAAKSGHRDRDGNERSPGCRCLIQ